MLLADRTMSLIVMVVMGLMMNQAPTAEASRIPAEDVSSCVEGSSFNDGCNDCVCSNGNAVCTQKACPDPWPEFPIIRDDAICTSEQFTCSNGNCISKSWHCDGDNDCGADDHSDEENCPIEECTPSQIQCPNGHCIEASWICDGESDCGDGFDEKQNCSEKIVDCREDEYSCYGGFQCIRREWLCDDDMDCPHGDDESLENCKMSCPTGSFTCGDNSCIPENLKCNGFSECPDHSDEKDCPTSDGYDGASVRSDGRCGPRFLAPNGRRVECNQNNNGNCCMVSEYCGGWNCQAE